MDNVELAAAIETLEIFNEKVAEINASSFADAIFDSNSGVTINFEHDKTINVQRRGPDTESIRAWSPTIRLLISKSKCDYISFEQMHLLYSKLPLEADLLQNLEFHNQAVKTFLSGPANIHTDMRIEPLKIDGQEPDVQTFLERFIYSDILHLDKSKRKDFVSWRNNEIIFALAQNRFCVLSSAVINSATELMDFNLWVWPKLQKHLAR